MRNRFLDGTQEKATVKTKYGVECRCGRMMRLLERYDGFKSSEYKCDCGNVVTVYDDAKVGDELD